MKVSKQTEKITSKKAIKISQKTIRLDERKYRLQSASFKVRKGSKTVNREWVYPKTKDI